MAEPVDALPFDGVVEWSPFLDPSAAGLWAPVGFGGGFKIGTGRGVGFPATADPDPDPDAGAGISGWVVVVEPIGMVSSSLA